ncbi:MAG: FtsX-like permease family protein, partial [Acidobacteriota bacterium]
GGGLGVLLAYAGVGPLLAENPFHLPGFSSVEVDTEILAAGMGLSLLASVGFSLIPALRLCRVPLTRATKIRGRNPAALHSESARRLIASAQVALAVVVLVCAGLLSKGLGALEATDFGFRTRGLLSITFQLNTPDYREDRQKSQFVRRILERLRAIPGVGDVSLWSPDLPGATISFMGVTPEGGWLGDRARARRSGGIHYVSPGALSHLEIPLLKGREITWEDREDHHLAAVLSKSMAQALWPDQDALGRRFHQTTRPGYDYTVVGIVEDSRQQGRRRPFGHERDIYLSNLQRPDPLFHLLVESEADPVLLTQATREAFHEVDPGLALFNAARLAEILDREIAAPRFTSRLTSFFAVISLLLGSLGIYSVLRYSVAQRTTEMGIRVALGARLEDIRGLVLRQGLTLIAPGLVLGTMAALALSRWLGGLLYGIGPFDWGTYASIWGIFLVVAAPACLLPAWKAARADPLKAIRDLG